MIGLFNYSVLNPAHAFNGSHWALVVGFDENNFYLHDPLRNAALPVSLAQFTAAISSLTPLGNPNYFAVYPQESLPMAMLRGVNIQPRQFASPAVDTLKGINLVRYPIIIKEMYPDGRETADQALAIYEPLIRTYHAAGIKTMLPLTHQIGLEGQGFPFDDPAHVDWSRVQSMYLERVEVIVRRFIGLGNIYQVFNEQDAQDLRASVVIPPVPYGQIFNATYALIKSIDPSATVITGGYNSGPGRGKQQFLAAKIPKTDGVAFHPYGASANGQYQGEGIPSLQSQIAAWQGLGLPLYISEWGALGFASEPVEKMAQFIDSFSSYCEWRIVAGVYFAWFPQDEHPYNSYPIINADGSVRQPIFKALVGDEVSPPDPVGLQVYINGATVVNARSAPSTTSTIVGAVKTGTVINQILELRYSGGYPWQRVNGVLNGVIKDFWLAVVGSSWKVDIR